MKAKHRNEEIYNKIERGGTAQAKFENTADLQLQRRPSPQLHLQGGENRHRSAHNARQKQCHKAMYNAKSSH